tara:strand:+ start:2482 stop:2673 length:192 start_codon:yes stop_codon:yes gene_type:complete
MLSLKRWIAEQLFESQLDEDFNKGLKVGQAMAKADARFKLETSRQASFKKYQPGVALAMDTLK